MTRRELFEAMALVSMLKGSALAFKGYPSTAQPRGTLGETALEKGILYGSSVSQKHLSTDIGYADLIARQCKIVTPESELKWKALRPAPNKFVFDDADWIVNWARSHGLLVRGTALVWHEALPRWFGEYARSGNAAALLSSHIKNVMRHFAGKIHSWDVVNEGLTDAGLRDTPWLQFLGAEYIDIAFRVAAEADPNAIRVYNQMNIEFTQNDAKRSQVLKLLEKLLSKGVPIQALGIQAHLRWDMGGFNPGKLAAFLKQVTDFGLQIFITEMDVRERDSDIDVNQRDSAVAAFYHEFLGTVLDQKAVKMVISWGLTDRYTWLTGYAPRVDHQPVRPLAFDQALAPKPCFNSIARALAATSAR